jgi:RNA polymerase sigma-70 factor (ECF subfamily)
MTRGELESRRRKFEREALIHIDALLKAAGRISGGSLDAQDIVQETYLRAWRYFNSFDAGSNCRGWLFRIMFNVINGRRGKLARLPESPLEEETGVDYERGNVVMFDPLKRIEGREVLEALNRISDEHRSVLWLVVVEGFAYREAAEILEVPIGTVMSRLHRARRELRKLLMTDRATGQG